MRPFTKPVLFALCLFVGCSSPPQSGSDEPDLTNITPDRIAELLYRTWCERDTRCVEWGGWSDVDYCTQAKLKGNEGIFDSASMDQPSVEAGMTDFNPDAFRECLLGIRDLSCETDLVDWNWRVALPACGEAFKGTRNDGESCISSVGCAADSFCLPSMETACDATCQKKGVGCVFDNWCNEGDICDDTQRCRAPNPAPGAEGMPCGEHRSCADGLHCDGTDASALVCRKLPISGESCSWSGQCADGAICVAGDFTCHPVLPEVGENAFCGSWYEIDAPTCRHDLLCVPNDDRTDGRCLKPKKRGESCTRLLECGDWRSNLICDTNAKRCVDRPKTGPCPATQFGDYCSPLESYCDSETDPAHPTCRPFKKTGEACTRDEECGVSGDKTYCWFQAGTHGTCDVIAECSP